MLQLCTLAQDYSISCSSADENLNTSPTGPASTPDDSPIPDRPAVSRDQCEVYVWGSNSSHQLAEGTQEKIMQPKQSSAFENVQQVFICIIVIYFVTLHEQCSNKKDQTLFVLRLEIEM